MMISNLEKAFENFEVNAEYKGILKVARTMLEKGMEVSFIAEMTGLTKEEVERAGKKPN